MQYWWVNQNKTHRQEVLGGFLWSPKTNKTGTKNPFYEFMTEVEVGDVIFSYFNQQIKAVGIATARAETSIKPDFGNAGISWSNEGWLVKAEFKVLEQAVSPKDHLDELLPLMPSKYAPLKTNGDGREFYLTKLPEVLALKLSALVGYEYAKVVGDLTLELDTSDAEGDEQENSIIGRTDIGATTKRQLTNSRRGQGIFKANVRLNESKCRVTGVTNLKHLIASHIKPWAESSDEEKLNGCNGLLLAPHVDHLFDKGLIGFADNGDMLISKNLNLAILDAWGIKKELNVGRFSDGQIVFLKFHREKHRLS